jgi:hypothetical protein
MGMSDPGGGYGWRSGRHLPARRGGLLGYGAIAERALAPDRPLCVLLLPEQVPAADWVAALEAAPGVVAVDPARLSYRAAARLPEALADALAALQARRLALPGVARAIVVFGPLQYPLARALLGRFPDAELWYGGSDDAEPRALHELAAARADLRFTAGAASLWERMERLGVESGRLGSERPDVR